MNPGRCQNPLCDVDGGVVTSDLYPPDPSQRKDLRIWECCKCRERTQREFQNRFGDIFSEGRRRNKRLARGIIICE